VKHNSGPILETQTTQKGIELMTDLITQISLILPQMHHTKDDKIYGNSFPQRPNIRLISLPRLQPSTFQANN
jgi:hypothetical protein